MFSLSYLPTAERLTVVVVKARNLKMSETQHPSLQNVFVKVGIMTQFEAKLGVILVFNPSQVYLLKDDKKVSKKRTSTKRSDCSPIFNESMIFSVPPYMLGSIQIRLTAVSATEPTASESGSVTPIGHVIVGSDTVGKGQCHWNQMLTSLRKPVAMWHAIRKTQSTRAQKDADKLSAQKTGNVN